MTIHLLRCHIFQKIKKLATMWHFEEMVNLAVKQEHSEIFLDAEDNWKPVLK